MAKVSKVSFTTQGTNTISVAGSHATVVKVSVPPEGRVTKVAAIQATGTAAAYVVDLIDSLVGPGLAAGSITTLPANIDLWRIIPQQTGSSGASLSFYDSGEIGYAYTTPDGTPTVRSRAIYLIISPTGASGVTTWEAVVTVESQYAT